MMAFNLFKKSKPQDEHPSPGAVESESPLPVSSEEDAKLLESQIEAIERVTEGVEEKQKEEPAGTQEEQHVGEIKEVERESQDVAREPEADKAPITTPLTPQETPHGVGETPRAEAPELGEEPPLPSREESEIEKMETSLEGYESKEQNEESEEPTILPPPSPPTAEKIQEEANAVSEGFEEEKGGASRFLRVGIIGLLIVIIIGGGVFAYLRFFGGVRGIPSLSFLQNIPFVGTYLGGEETPKPGAPFVPVAPEATSTPSPVSFPEPAPSPVVTSEERDNQRIADIDNLGTQLAAYYAAGGSYPSTDGETEKIISGAIELSIYEALVPAYLTILPVDSNPQFYYGYTSDGSSYELTSVLENQDHPECVLAGNYCVRKIRDGEVVSMK